MLLFYNSYLSVKRIYKLSSLIISIKAKIKEKNTLKNKKGTNPSKISFVEPVNNPFIMISEQN